MELSFQHYLLGLFAVANNIPAIPIYLALCSDLTPAEQRKVCSVATAASLITMIVSMVCGALVLSFFQVSIDAFRIAGGILLVQTGINMVNTRPEPALTEKRHLSEMISVAVIPLAIPLTTGAGTISTVILFSERLPTDVLVMKLLAAILVVTIVNYTLFRSSASVIRFLGHTGMDVVTKVFGLITLALGIQFVLTGLEGTFPGLIGHISLSGGSAGG